MPGRGDSQALVRFEDVIVHFSREEWRILKESQKDLYWEVLKDTYKALLSAGGSPVTKSDVLAWFEQYEHQNLKRTQKSRNGDSSGSSCTSNDRLAKMCHEECTEEVRCFTVVHDRSEEVMAQCGNAEGVSEHLPMSVMQQGSPLRAVPFAHTEYEKSIQELARFAYSSRTVTVSKPFECGGHGERRKGLPQIRQKIRTKNVSFRCPECGTGFPSNLHLRMHWRVHIHASIDGRKNSPSLEPAQPVHPQKSRAGEKLHLCALCGKSFQKYLRFLQHQKGHDDAKPHPCAQCEVVFMFQSDLEIHEESHLEEAIGEQTTCGKNCICDISLQLHFASQFKKHVESSKSGLQSYKQSPQMAQCKEKPYSCDQCEQQFTLEVNLEAHYRYCHKEWLLKRQLNCSVPNSLLQHEKVHTKQESPTSAPGNGTGFQNSGPPSSQSCTLCSCSSCGEWFVSKFSLRKHQKRHNHGGAAKHDRKTSFRGGFGGSSLALAHATKKLHSCQECGKKFVYKWQLGMHLKAHAQEKQPLFLNCESILTHKADLGQHRKMLAKRGACKDGKRRQHASEPALAVNQRKCAKEEHSQCEECGKIVRKNYLPQHQAVHAGLRHKCLLCAKICVFRSGALNHLRRHWQKGDFATCYEDREIGSSRPCACMIERIYVGQGQQKQQYALDRVPQPSEGSPTNSLPAEHGQSLGADSCLGVQSHGPSRGKQARWVKSWKSELKQYRNSVPREFKCLDCGKEFTCIAFLMMHRKMHKCKQLYPCNKCGKNFINSFYLDMHRKRHAKESA